MKVEPPEQKMPVRGRPRLFDRDVVLDRAMHLFWTRGYDTTSMSELIVEMGVTAPSIYSMFGDKRGLFMAAIERYWQVHSSGLAELLAQAPTARAGIGRMFELAAASVLDRGRPSGCMLALSTVNCAKGSDTVRDAVAAYRVRTEAAFCARIERGMADGDVPAGTDAGALASFCVTVLYGMSIKARDGADHAAMAAVAALAMQAWPARG